MEDITFMHRCLELAARGRGRVGVNPLVGSVLVRKGSVIAEGWHEGFGLAHAERALLERFKGTMEPADVLYVNLEPCCHHGKTLPCIDLILEKGVKHVVYGMQDPAEHAQGKGILTLRAAGVDVRGPVLPELAARLNRGFVSLHTQGRPWVTLKMARTRAGAVSNVDGSPLKITSREQDAWAHEFLRGTHDAIIVGVETVLSDDPQLTRRILNKKIDHDSYHPLRIVLDPNFRIPENAKLVSEFAVGTIVVTAPGNIMQPKCASLRGRGVNVFPVPLDGRLFDFAALWKVLITSSGDFHGVVSALVEGGRRTWDAFRKARVVDEEVLLVGDEY
ncbi:TPA: bifunctional diaminohydroxyphosphoribosylaminopyrimidine deaminase/5-amino-6-(5-phosphoribosylamino)uracil reductase RibD [Candidatus Peribacteria bacterium]|nr:MAG: riboflavin biosynthesis protein RibD [Candidatus Peribacteria bacterium RIFOXYC2_FULL_58_10]OGJ83972.1 MAG: riboflavin biosynthesis protein RibD [Candidatus Peribacteria bacterium RIFOXYD2_FULL_58_15]HAI98696.1 bifunctional diaminohydroxyphosphoribosylaminopyrimidine deaminase/5-amino-6-(5-phosphoribosylamino)uracil reductase RibD [Candidatus Peribacteria bacterium]HAS34409.1 bifunctional diaminohydroxyphosphoribosylaminopyrimidine deaminase/5-amino-6-(5-phosphoribosylamino)uracil reduct